MTPPIFSQFSSGGGGRAAGFGMGGPSGGSGLYDFTYASFEGNNGRSQNGPNISQARSGLSGGETSSWKNDTNFFTESGGRQFWTVPITGSYRIEAHGARGGYTSRGGCYGARMRGDFDLTEGEQIRIVIGQQGQQGGHSQGGQGGGGGGGTYVTRSPHNSNGNILVVAGGGGSGAGNPWSNRSGDNASTSQCSNSGGGGGNACSGNGGGGSSTGSAGAGFFGDATQTGSCTPNSQRARSYTNGSTGGRGARCWGGPDPWGGFGGGGGGGGLCSGGGGGYSGGGAGEWSSQQRGGGGGSYNNGSNQSNSRSNRGGNGQVTVEFLG